MSVVLVCARLVWVPPECQSEEPSMLPYVPKRSLVTLCRVSRDLDAELYPALWATFAPGDIVRASGAEQKGLS